MINIYRVLRTGFVDFWRNRWLSLATIAVMTVTIFTIALSILLSFAINQTAKTLESQLDVKVFFNDAATMDQINSLKNTLLARSDVQSVTFTSKQQALQQFRAESKYRTTVLQLLDQGYGNDLPSSISIKTTDPSYLSDVASFVSQPTYAPLVKQVSYQENKQLIDKFISSTAFVKELGWVLSALFIGISVLVIYNTVMLMIFNRREEIEIMQLVGASSWYIRSPFVLEGVVYGLSASVITTIILVLIAKTLSPYVDNYINSPSFHFMQFFTNHLLFIIGVEIFVGVVIGAACSYLAVRKHLRSNG